MTPKARDLLDQALHLDDEDRAFLAEALVESLRRKEEPAADETWGREIRQRLKELDSGVETVLWSEERSRLFRGD